MRAEDKRKKDAAKAMRPSEEFGCQGRRSLSHRPVENPAQRQSKQADSTRRRTGPALVTAPFSVWYHPG